VNERIICVLEHNQKNLQNHTQTRHVACDSRPVARRSAITAAAGTQMVIAVSERKIVTIWGKSVTRRILIFVFITDFAQQIIDFEPSL
jgi:hypothetical protein